MAIKKRLFQSTCVISAAVLSAVIFRAAPELIPPGLADSLLNRENVAVEFTILPLEPSTAPSIISKPQNFYSALLDNFVSSRRRRSSWKYAVTVEDSGRLRLTLNGPKAGHLASQAQSLSEEYLSYLSRLKKLPDNMQDAACFLPEYVQFTVNVNAAIVQMLDSGLRQVKRKNLNPAEERSLRSILNGPKSDPFVFAAVLRRHAVAFGSLKEEAGQAELINMAIAQRVQPGRPFNVIREKTSSWSPSVFVYPAAGAFFIGLFLALCTG